MPPGDGGGCEVGLADLVLVRLRNYIKPFNQVN